MRYLILTLLLVGCTQALPAPRTDSAPSYDWSGEPSERAIERWETVRARVSPQCADQVRGTPIHWVDPAQVSAPCGPNALACFLPQGEIVMPNNAYQQMLVHEFMHAIASCEMHGTDSNHELPGVWAGLMCTATSCPTERAAD